MRILLCNIFLQTILGALHILFIQTFFQLSPVVGSFQIGLYENCLHILCPKTTHSYLNQFRSLTAYRHAFRHILYKIAVNESYNYKSIIITLWKKHTNGPCTYRSLQQKQKKNSICQLSLFYKLNPILPVTNNDGIICLNYSFVLVNTS